MSILDDAIREHLELKRQHGADDAELKRLEDEAFGPPSRPEEEVDPFAEAPTEFLVTPGSEGEEPPEGAAPGDLDEPGSGRRINVADLQEPPPPPQPPAEEQTAMEHEIVEPAPEAEAASEPEADAGPDTEEERHAIAEQPTEIFDVEGDLAEAAGAESPSDEDLADAELSEPRLAPVDPLGEVEASGPAEEAPPTDEEIEEHADEFDEFFSEQRLSDELNQALEAPLDDEPLGPPEPLFEDEPAAAEPAPAAEDEYTEEEPAAEEDDAPHRNFAEEEDDEDDEHPASQHDDEHQDALEGTPDFLADDPEDDNLWFEQKPPKDIDFGD